MSLAETLQTPKRELLGGEYDQQSSRRGPKFYRSLRSRGYIIFILLLAYLVLATVFFFNQREKSLLKLEEYQKIQQAQAELVKADIVAIHFDRLLFSNVTPTEFQQVAGYFSSLEQQYRNLALLFPEQVATFARLEQSIPRSTLESEEIYLQSARLHLAESINEIERLIAANQVRLTNLIQQYQHQEDLLGIKLLVLGAVGLIQIGALTAVFFNRLKSDLLRLQQRTAEIARGGRVAPLPITREDEVGQLIDATNDLSQALADREQSLEIRRRKTSFQEKMIAIDSLAGGIAHEVGNPITCIAGLAVEIANDAHNVFSQQSRSMLEQLQQYTNGIVNITRDLSQFDTNNIDRSEWIDINQLLTNSVNLCHYDHRWSGIAIKLDLDPGIPAMYASETQINQCTMHILESALDALAGQHDPRVLLGSGFDAERGIRIVFQNNAAGIKEDDLKHIFEPVLSTRSPGEGTGLGLAICRAIVESYKGEIHAEATPGSELKIVVDFPVEMTSLNSSVLS
ncbi:MAG: HAMP domain-containing histidine kinase [Gammaproteobacteria bacterium]|jgi:signal transduction histidine kinase|nr:HAMP domain-containing histidine kinase [Gammaproteobacteria bacterium]